MKSFFKKLVLSIVALYLVYMLIPFGWHLIYSEETLNALSWNGHGGLISLYGPTPYFFAAFFFFSLFGLYKFKKWGRSCFMAYSILSGILLPIWGLAIIGGADGVVSYFVTLISGFVLSLAYFSSLNEEFS